jgi:hypothetical protein
MAGSSIRRDASKPAPQPANASVQGEVVSTRETLFLLLGVLGIFPWAIVWVMILAPKVGLGRLGIKAHLIIVLVTYLLPVWLLTRKKQ